MPAAPAFSVEIYVHAGINLRCSICGTEPVICLKGGRLSFNIISTHHRLLRLQINQVVLNAGMTPPLFASDAPSTGFL